MSLVSARTVRRGTAISHQYAALPYRMNGDVPEILLVTSLRTRRWILPKGWPMRGRAPCECAAREALEEAGVEGEVQPHPIGSYRYLKELKSGANVTCEVAVFALRVTSQRRKWREKAVRNCLWLVLPEAVRLIAEPDVRRLILKFGEQFGRATKKV